LAIEGMPPTTAEGTLATRRGCLATEGAPATAHIQYQEHHEQAAEAETLATVGGGGYIGQQKGTQANQTHTGTSQINNSSRGASNRRVLATEGTPAKTEILVP
jgi:hypothetical protein